MLLIATEKGYNSMKKLSLKLLSETVVNQRNALKMTQTQLSEATGINRSILSRLESGDYIPSVSQLPKTKLYKYLFPHAKKLAETPAFLFISDPNTDPLCTPLLPGAS